MQMRFAAFLPAALLAVLGPTMASCGRGEAPPPAAEADPARCEAVALGEAADLFEKGDPPSGVMARVDGLTDPRTLVWKDEVEDRVYFITRVMGTERRLYYMAPVEPGEEPRALSVVSGHLQRWSEMNPKKAATLARALEQQYSLQITPESTFLITAGEKPAGCP